MDDDLKVALWNALTVCYWNKMESSSIPAARGLKDLLKDMWVLYFKKPIDTLKDYWPSVYEELRSYYFECEWYKVYDFIEFCAKHYPIGDTNESFMSICNSFLKNELSGYRFVSGQITEITSDEEIEEIEEAISLKDTKLKPVTSHLKSALAKLSDRKAPDYRNSIKESISAVESICNIISGSDASLGKTLKDIDNVLAIHPALQNAFDKMYGYTSNEGGIRHAMLDETEIDYEDAKYMLVACSAFINYLIVKASKSGAKLS